MNTLSTLPDWPRAHGGPLGSAVLRENLTDFEVEELPIAAPAGRGEHLWLWVEKRGQNTDWVARELARAAGVRPRDVGYAGRKDRHALTRQYFSVLAGAEAETGLRRWQADGIDILHSRRHPRKLKRGALRGNRFQIRLRGLAVDASALEERLHAIKDRGVPNYFGEQRFGRNGANLQHAEALLFDGRRYSRNRRSLLLSAVRSLLFNSVLAERVVRGQWDRLLAGDIVQLSGSRSRFAIDRPDEELIRRCERFDITPTGPLPGRGSSPGRFAGELEQQALLPLGKWLDGLEREKLTADRRPLRLAVQALDWKLEGTDLTLSFDLPPGAFATAVLREIVAYRDAQRKPEEGATCQITA